MIECEECGKKLGIMEGYKHPTMGKKHHLCSPCFDQVSESVARWGEFVNTNSFNIAASKSNSMINFKKITTSFTQLSKNFENLGAQKGIYTDR